MHSRVREVLCSSSGGQDLAVACRQRAVCPVLPAGLPRAVDRESDGPEPRCVYTQTCGLDVADGNTSLHVGAGDKEV